ncbi:MAG TPA: phosphatase PAP2 family protein [Candidatus Cloacimonetes bacterium]|nr:phosphatase PAP2 family protein [Candidatus Cloacimonadota bacterium]
MINPGKHSQKNRFRPIDILTFLYILINLLYIIFGWKRVHNPHIHFPVFLMIGIVIYILIRNEKHSGILSFLRDWYPVIAFTYFFEATSALNKVIFPDFLDPFFQKIDFHIFGYQPAIVWGIKLDYFWLQELMHFAYFCYYLMIPVLGFLLYFKKREAFHRFVFSISFLFYFCYLIFNILPVIGGRALEGATFLTTEYRYGIFTRIMALIYNNTAHLGGAFPSSHVAVAVGVTISALRDVKWFGWILIPISFLLSISTIYCHYHYFIDTVAGLFFGIGIYYLGLKIYGKYAEKEINTEKH